MNSTYLTANIATKNTTSVTSLFTDIIGCHVISIFGCSSLNEIYMITERYFTIKSKKKGFLIAKLKFYVPTLFSVPIFITIIFFFDNELKKSRK